MTDDELKALQDRAEHDEPSAMFEYAQVLLNTDKPSAEKYIELAAQLGNPQALAYMGERYMESGDVEKAKRAFKSGAKAGMPDCAVKLAVIMLDGEDKARAISELEELAEAGVSSACEALANYYLSQGNKKQYAYWRSKAN